MAECPASELQCSSCDIWHLKSETSDHDCFRAMTELSQLQGRELEALKEEYGMNVEKLNLRCSNQHLLLLQMSRPNDAAYHAPGGSAGCDKCSEPNLEMHEYFYHCAQCQYDLCRACALIQARILPEEGFFCVHPHKLKRYEANRRSGWACDVGYKKLGICPSGITNFRQGYHLHSWRCQRCDFDLCIGCCLKYLSIDLKKLKASELDHYFCIIFSADNIRMIARFANQEEAKSMFKKHKAKNKILIGRRQLLAECAQIPEAEREKKFNDALEEARKAGILATEESKDSESAKSVVYVQCEETYREIRFEDQEQAEFYFSTSYELTSRILVHEGRILGEAGLAFEVRQMKEKLAEKNLEELSAEAMNSKGAVYWHQLRHVYKYSGPSAERVKEFYRDLGRNWAKILVAA